MPTNFPDHVQRALMEAAEDRLDFVNRLIPSLTIDGEDFTTRIIEKNCEGAEDESVFAFSVTLFAAMEERDYATKKVALDYYIAGTSIKVAAYRGEVVTVRSDGYRTRIEAKTASYHAERTQMRQTRSYTESLPRDVMFDAISRIRPHYDSTNIIAPTEPPITYDGANRIGAGKSVSSVIEIVEAEANCLLSDSQTNCATLIPLKTPASQGDAIWSIVEGEDTPAGGVVVETQDGERFYAVEVIRTIQEGTRAGEDESLAYVEINNHGIPVSTTDVLVMEYQAEEGESAAESFRRADEMARTEARRRSKAPVKVTADLIYPLFWVWRGDTVTVTKTDLTDEGTWYRTYLVRLRGNSFDVTGQVTGEGESIGDVFVKRERQKFGQSLGTRLLWGTDYSGRAVLTDELDWLTFTDTEVIVDPELASLAGVTAYYDEELRRVVIDG